MKTKNRRNVWMCCSVLEVKGKKEKKTPALINSCDETAGKHENTISRIFGQSINSQFTACICCSVIEESLPPPEENTKSSYDKEMEVSKGAMTLVTGIPSSK
ncbi:Uncharacterized protein Adt_27430 [Abeliophyllum distichum]|uniref:Uncharacterized protein n=1 Tax=Abeliophyllum distichum TaxID=126358 RepID=A0ABD1RTP3_9LAMI